MLLLHKKREKTKVIYCDIDNGLCRNDCILSLVGIQLQKSLNTKDGFCVLKRIFHYYL